MTRDVLVATVNAILSKFQVAAREQDEALKEQLAQFPVKAGDKVSIHTRDDGFVRHTYVNRVEISLRGMDRKARVEFELQKCKADGTKRDRLDYLGMNEYVTVD